MAAKIRLKKVGRKGQPSYRIVVLDGRKPRDAKVVADLGHYDPKTEPATFSVDQDLALKWLRDGAKATKAARDILSKSGVMATWSAGLTETPAEPEAPAKAEKTVKAKKSAKAEEAGPEEAAKAVKAEKSAKAADVEPKEAVKVKKSAKTEKAAKPEEAQAKVEGEAEE
jgi:small subunit ribosomal protein S16